MQQPQVAVLNIDRIKVQAGFNRRRAFRKEPFERLVDSIRQDGLIQPVTVRPDPDVEGDYLLIAGERRWRACKEVGIADVPTLIRDCNDEEAARLNVLENLDRADLSPAEEAMAARDILDLCGGSVPTAAKQLGWAEAKLRSRMLLLACAPDVLQAVADGTLLVGHAELISGLPHETQNKVLPRIIERNMTVEALREEVRGVLISLSRAIFDTAGCNGCISNTQTQGALFTNAIGGANCQNRKCFSAKTQAHIDQKRAALAEEVSTVALASEKDPSTYTALIVNGEGGVGEAQFAACRSCQHFGAVIHDQLDANAGKVQRPVCFSLPCHSKMVEAAAVPLADPAPRTTTTAKASPGKLAPSGSTASAGKAKAKTPAPAASSSAARAAMRPAYSAAASHIVATDTKASLAMAVYGLHTLLKGGAGTSPLAKFKPVEKGAKPEEVIAALYELSEPEIIAHLRACSAAMVDGSKPMPTYSNNDVYPAVIAARLVQAAGSSLDTHFAMTDAFLAAHTKEAIEAILEEAGFKKWMHNQDDGAKHWKALLSNKKADLPKAIMGKGFDFKSFVPKAVTTASPRGFVGV